MLLHTFTILLRSFRREWLYTLINVSGLSLGMAATLVMILYLQAEYSYDKHFVDSDRIYRVGTSFFNLGEFASGPEALVPALQEGWAPIEQATRLKSVTQLTIRVEDERYRGLTAYAVDTNFFEVFSYEFIRGSSRSWSSSAFGVVLLESEAIKLFGTTDALGRRIEVGDDLVPHTVAGVIRQTKQLSHMHTAVWIPITPYLKDDENFASAAFHNYVKLRAGYDANDLDDVLAQLIKERVYPVLAGGMSYEEWLTTANAYKLYPLAIPDIHLKSKLRFELTPGANESNVMVFSGVALFILIIASFNFVNLSTARSSVRAKEVGIKKSMGTARAQLVTQFLAESVALALIAVVVAIGLSEILMMLFEQISGRAFNSPLPLPVRLLLVVTLALTVGIIAGAYPAFYLTSFNPVHVIKGGFQKEGGKVFKGGLVVIQFAISISLLVISLVIISQIRFMEHKDLGFEQQNVVILRGLGADHANKSAFANSIAQLSPVEQVSWNTGEPAGNSLWIYTYQTPQMDREITLHTFRGDHRYLDVMGFRLLKGRNFSEDLASDTASVILNESAVRALQLGNDPVGKEVNPGVHVIGVVSDFHFESLRNEVAPAVLAYAAEGYQLAVKVRAGQSAAFIEQASVLWQEFSPEDPLAFHFVSDNYEALLTDESRLMNALLVFTCIAIFISSLGLFGLSTYMAQRRAREIGIRKVLGASVQTVVLLLNKHYLLLLLASMAIAFPVAYLVMSEWLTHFAYHIDLNIVHFLAGGCIISLVAIATVTYQSLAAGLTNPVNVLKEE